MTGHDDLELRRRFAEARDADALDAPSFENATRRVAGGGPRRAAGLAPAAALAATAVIATVVWLNAPRHPSPSADEAIAQASALSSWDAPTDAWLEVSGLEIPDSIPSLSPSSVALPELNATASAPSGELR